jgi:hypothetical protein
LGLGKNRCIRVVSAEDLLSRDIAYIRTKDGLCTTTWLCSHVTTEYQVNKRQTKEYTKNGDCIRKSNLSVVRAIIYLTLPRNLTTTWWLIDVDVDVCLVRIVLPVVVTLWHRRIVRRSPWELKRRGRFVRQRCRERAVL